MDQISTSSQDYLEAILELSKEARKIRSIDLAQKLGVSRASVNRAVGVLKNAGFVLHEKYSEISLTEEGIKAALAVKERHNTLKRFLTEVLGVSERTAEDDACKMEHGISVETLERLQDFIKNCLDEYGEDNKKGNDQ